MPNDNVKDLKERTEKSRERLLGKIRKGKSFSSMKFRYHDNFGKKVNEPILEKNILILIELRHNTKVKR